MRDHSERRATVVATLFGALLALAGGSTALAQGRPLPPIPEPTKNPITEAKRVLGKVLFSDEQLSSDDTVACATRHVNAASGTDPRRARHPGSDGVVNTGDGVLASPGVVSQDAAADQARLRDRRVQREPLRARPARSARPRRGSGLGHRRGSGLGARLEF